MHDPPLAPPRPNIIWFFGDQHRAQATSLAGDPNVRTPHIDRLAAGGVWFPRAISGCPWCTPFRGSLLTGLYPHRNVYQTPMRMAPSLPTVAHAFNDAGYDTAWFGKWHLARRTGEAPPIVDGRPKHTMYPIPRDLRGGFGSWLGYESNSRQYDTWLQGHTAGGDEIDLHPLGKYETDGLTDLLVDDLRGRAAGGHEARPFFTVCSIQPPHDPYDPPAKWLSRHDPGSIRLRPNVPSIEQLQQAAREQLAAYYGAVECLDDNLGRVMKTLVDTGLWDNTYLLFFSDHGDMHWSHGFRGKSMPWEESIRIPFIVGGGAARGAAGRTSEALLSSVDIAPTTLRLAGIEAPHTMPGFDYSPSITAATAPDCLAGEPDSVLCQHLVPKRHKHGMDCTWRAVVTRDGWKYICTEGAALGMFNLREDPYEQQNCAWDHGQRDRRRQLIERLGQWLDDVGDTYPLPGPPTG